MGKAINLFEMKKIQLDILDYISQICEKEKIQYYLDGGTLLGAVRHKGYIPWDDDIDIIMKREDYDRFIKIVGDNEGPYSKNRYKLLTKDNTDDYYYLFSKMIDSKTLMYEKGLPEVKELGVYVDIFPLDYLPSDPHKRKKYQRKVWVERKKKDLAISWKMKDFKVTRFLLCFYYGKIIGLHKMLDRVERIVKTIPDKVPMYCNDMVAGLKEYISTSIDAFKQITMLSFEGTERPAPIGYDNYLTNIYGDYMKLPPKEKRVSHHYFEAYWKEEE